MQVPINIFQKFGFGYVHSGAVFLFISTQELKSFILKMQYRVAPVRREKNNLSFKIILIYI